MEPSSDQPNDKLAKEGVSSLQAEIEAIKDIDSELYSSIQEEMAKANKLWEKAHALLSDISDQEILVLRSIKIPHAHICGVFAAWKGLMAGHVPEACIKVNEKKNPVDVSWDSMRTLLKDWSFFKEKMLTVKGLIDEGKISFEKTEPVREYLGLEWFNVENLKKKPVGFAWQMGEAIMNVIVYFDIIRDVKGKIREGGKLKEKED